MTQQYDWCFVGSLGKHNGKPAVKLQRTPAVKPFNRLAPSLAALPAEVLACIYSAQEPRSSCQSSSNLPKPCVTILCSALRCHHAMHFWCPSCTQNISYQRLLRIYTIGNPVVISNSNSHLSAVCLIYGVWSIETMDRATFSHLLENWDLRGYRSAPVDSHTGSPSISSTFRCWKRRGLLYQHQSDNLQTVWAAQAHSVSLQFQLRRI